MTVNLPGKLRAPMASEVEQWLYHSQSDYCTALALWDIYSRQHHERTGPLLQLPVWRVESFVDGLLRRRGDPVERGSVKPYRFSVRLPDPLYQLVRVRMKEEGYRGDSAFFIGLIVYALDPDVPPNKKGVPHHHLAELFQRPRRIRDAVLSQIIQDFGKPDRVWPKRIDELVSAQLRLPI